MLMGISFFLSFFFSFFIFSFLVFGFQDKISLCSPGCPVTYSVDQAGPVLRVSPASVSLVVGLTVCTTNAWQNVKGLSREQGKTTTVNNHR